MARSAALCQGPARCRGQPCKRAGWVARNRSTRHNRPTGQGGSAWADETCARGRTDVAASRRRAREPLPKRTATALLALNGCSKRQGILQTCRQEAPTPSRRSPRRCAATDLRPLFAGGLRRREPTVLRAAHGGAASPSLARDDGPRTQARCVVSPVRDSAAGELPNDVGGVNGD